MAQYKRILLKLSGESLMGGKQYGIDEVRLNEYATQNSRKLPSHWMQKTRNLCLFGKPLTGFCKMNSLKRLTNTEFQGLKKS